MLGLRARTLRGGIEDIRTDHVLGPPGDGAPLVDQAAAVPPVGENQCRACPGGNTAGLEVSLLRPWGVESREPALKIIVEIHEERELRGRSRAMPRPHVAGRAPPGDTGTAGGGR